MMKEYIHYGSKNFSLELFSDITNRIMFSKPNGGFWATPVNSKNNWLTWCKENKFGNYRKENSFTFTLDDKSNVLMLTSLNDLMILPHINNEFSVPWHCLDFEKIKNDGIDAIEVKIQNLYFELYGWDCDSILIMNPKIIIERKM